MQQLKTLLGQELFSSTEKGLKGAMLCKQWVLWRGGQPENTFISDLGWCCFQLTQAKILELVPHGLGEKLVSLLTRGFSLQNQRDI